MVYYTKKMFCLKKKKSYSCMEEIIAQFVLTGAQIEYTLGKEKELVNNPHSSIYYTAVHCVQ